MIQKVYYFLAYFTNGLIRLVSDIKMLIVFVCTILILWIIQNAVNNLFLIDVLFVCFKSFLIVYLIYKIGIPKRAKQIYKGFQDNGIQNKSGEIPILLKVKQEKDSHIKEYIFRNCNLNIQNLLDSSHKLKPIFKEEIFDVQYGSSTDIIKIYTYDSCLFENTIYWNDSFLQEDKKILLGMSPSGKVYLDFKHMPHGLIAGVSGCGKSQLMQSILYQCIMHEYCVIIADMKGGLDYNYEIFRSSAKLITEVELLIQELEEIDKEFERRKQLLYQSGARNIDEYNKGNVENLPRIVVAIDEIVDVTDKVGLTKDEKSQISQIEKYLNHYARLGRAMGLHLILSTQRPSADVLSGQIKSNIGYRICGKGDSILSDIVLDDSNLTSRIPDNVVGVFVMKDGTIFKGFYLDKAFLEFKVI